METFSKSEGGSGSKSGLTFYKSVLSSCTTEESGLNPTQGEEDKFKKLDVSDHELSPDDLTAYKDKEKVKSLKKYNSNFPVTPTTM